MSKFYDIGKAFFSRAENSNDSSRSYLTMTREVGKIEGTSTPSIFQVRSVILLQQSLLRSLVAIKGQMITRHIIATQTRVKNMGSAAQKLISSDVNALLKELILIDTLFLNLVL